MTVLAREIRHNVGRNHPVRTREALASYARSRWHVGAAKAAASEWELTVDEGKAIVAGRASQTTIDKIWAARRGGWAVALPVLSAVIRQQLDTYLQGEARGHARQAIEADEMVRYLRGVLGADDPGSDDLDIVEDDGGEPYRR